MTAPFRVNWKKKIELPLSQETLQNGTLVPSILHLS